MKKLLIGTIAFFMTILLILIIILSAYNSTINNKNYLLSVLEKNNFYSELHSAINEHFEEYVLQSGLPEDIFTGLVSDEFVKNIVNENIDSFYSYVHNQSLNLEISLDISELETELMARIDKFISESGIVSSAETQTSIDEYINVVFEPFTLNSTIMSGITAFSDYLNTIHTFYRLAMGGAIIAIIVLLVFLFMLYKNLLSSLVCVLAITLSSGIIIRLFSELLIRNEIINNFYILSLYFSNTITSYIQGIFNLLITITNIVFIGVLVIFVVLLAFIRKNK